MEIFQLDAIQARRAASGRTYLEFLRTPALSMGVYALRAGEADPQRPHTEDEVYYVSGGRGMIRVGTDDRPVKPGTIICVPAWTEHWFHSVTEDLTVLVFFAPAEGTGTRA